jgi:uncharacterized protein YcsI (UPF0317 family)
VSTERASRPAAPAEVRRRIAAGEITGPTAALCPGYLQANLVVLPADWAEDFRRFCRENPRPCPLLEVLEAGRPRTRRLASGADVRTELPRYRVWRHGEIASEPTDVTALWRDDLVSFFLGCSFTFDEALISAGLPVRHVEQGVNVPMYRTTRPARPAGRLSGPLVVSMRPMPAGMVERAREVSGRFGGAHGAPVHAGDPAELGIEDLAQPHYGDPVSLGEGEVPVFWACGVTPQAALAQAKPPFAITHAPGHMFITDLTADELGSLEPVT